MTGPPLDVPPDSDPGVDPGYDTVYPLRHVGDPPVAQPFPTIYWLADPELDKQLAELERLGHIKRLEAEIQADADLRKRVHADHEQYRNLRWAMLRDEDRRAIEAAPTLAKAFRGGVGGTVNFDTLKCLHAHYAYHLARAPHGGTAVGALIDQLLRR